MTTQVYPPPTPTDPAVLADIRLHKAKFALECAIGYAREAYEILDDIDFDDIPWAQDDALQSIPKLQHALDTVTAGLDAAAASAEKREGERG